MKRIQELVKDNNGEVMLEAAIIFPMVLILVFSLISMGFLYYQKIMVQVIADETAAYIAAGYKYTENFLQNDELSYSNVSDRQMYRASFFVNKMTGTHEGRANEYVDYRMGYGNLGINSGTPQAEVTITVDNVGRMHVTCVVTLECEIFLGNVLEYADIIDDAKLTFTGTGRAEVLDITAYAGYVHFLDYLSSAADSSFGPDTAVGKLVGSFNTIIKAFE